MLTNVRERLVEKTVPFFAPVKRNSSKTFASLHKCSAVNRNNEKKMIKADCQLIQQLLKAAQAGHNTDMELVLRHELSPVPLALATIDGNMNSVQKMFTNSVRMIDVVFDRYIGQESIKAMTRGKRAVNSKLPIQKMINDGNVILSQVWSQFSALNEKKAETARFLTQHFIDHGPNIDQVNEIVTAEWFEEQLVKLFGKS
ncbi:hypothetical protein SK128_021513 [Halocaridina rubra]|uniref:Uncharacterized protein n=1 Tax=Halocaridina rubra TaxID=373956 RepID=A0AAN8ZVM0_HALRR